MWHKTMEVSELKINLILNGGLFAKIKMKNEKTDTGGWDEAPWTQTGGFGRSGSSKKKGKY